MRVTPISDNLIQLTRLRFVNAYLVREDDGFTLVDTMVGGSADGILAAAQAAGGTIARIALTHGHADHVGSVDELRSKLGAEVEISIGEIRRAHPRRRESGGRQADRKLAQAQDAA